MRSGLLSVLVLLIVAGGLCAHAYLFTFHDGEMLAGFGVAGLAVAVLLVLIGIVVARLLKVREWPARWRARRARVAEEKRRAAERRAAALEEARAKDAERRASAKESLKKGALTEQEKIEAWRERATDAGAEIPIGANRISHDLFINPVNGQTMAVNVVMAPLYYFFAGPAYLVHHGMKKDLGRVAIAVITAAFVAVLPGRSSWLGLFLTEAGLMHIGYCFVVTSRLRKAYRERGWPHVEADRY